MGRKQLMMQPQGRVYTWAQVEQMCYKILDDMKRDGKYDTCTGVYGLPRGGLIPAAIISYKTGWPMLMAPQRNCLIIDDDCWSGQTLQHWTQQDEQQWEYTIACLADRYSAVNDGKPAIVDYAGETFDEPIDVVYPWNSNIPIEEEPWLYWNVPVEPDEPQLPIIAVDFDGTLAVEKYGKEDEWEWTDEDLIKAIIETEREGKANVVLWTCRIGRDLGRAIKHLERHGWSPKYVNENVDKTLPDCRKIWADLFIDNLGMLPSEFAVQLVKNPQLIKKQC